MAPVDLPLDDEQVTSTAGVVSMYWPGLVQFQETLSLSSSSITTATASSGNSEMHFEVLSVQAGMHHSLFILAPKLAAACTDSITDTATATASIEATYFATCGLNVASQLGSWEHVVNVEMFHAIGEGGCFYPIRFVPLIMPLRDALLPLSTCSAHTTPPFHIFLDLKNKSAKRARMDDTKAEDIVVIDLVSDDEQEREHHIIDDADDGDEEDAEAAKSGYYYDKDEDMYDRTWPTNIMLDFSSDEESTSFGKLGIKLKCNNSFLSFVGGEREDAQVNDFVNVCIANKYALTTLTSLTEVLGGSDFDLIRNTMTGLRFVSCTLLVNDIEEIEAFCKVLGTFPHLKKFSSDSSMFCAAGSGLVTDGEPGVADRALIQGLLPGLVRWVPLLTSLNVSDLRDDMVLDLCDAVAEKLMASPAASHRPISLIAHGSQISVSTCERIAELMARWNCFQKLDLTDLKGLSDTHAIALTGGVQQSRSLHTLDLHLNSRRERGLTTIGIEAIVNALIANPWSILCKFDVSAEEQPQISDDLQRRLRKCLRKGCQLAKQKVAAGSTNEADKTAQTYMQYAYMPAYFKHEVHEH